MGGGSGELIKSLVGSTQPFSICTWYYTEDTNRAILFGDYATGSYTVNMELTAATVPAIRFIWANGSSSSQDMYIANSSITLAHWAHLAITYDGTNLYTYLDGILVNTRAVAFITRTKSNSIYMLGRDGRTGATAFSGKLQDFRVYNTCLSIKEIKEIQKALVLHYPLDNNGLYANNLFKGSALRPIDRTPWQAISSSDRVDSIASMPVKQYNNGIFNWIDEGGIYTAEITLNTSGNNGIAFQRLVSEFDFDPTVYYTISVEAQCSVQAAKLSIGLSYLTTGNSWVWRGGQNAYNFNAANTWQTFSLTFKPDSNTQAISYCITSNYGNNAVLKLRKAKLEKGTVVTPWTPEQAEINDLFTFSGYGERIYDTSGYQNNGYIRNAPCTLTTKTPRYQVASSFISGQCIMTDKSSSVILPRTGLTYSIWFKSANPGARFISCTEGGGFNLETANGSVFSPIVYVTGTGYVRLNSNTTYTSLANDWHMITVTYQDGILALYIDGQLDKSATVANNTISYPSATPLTLAGEAQGLNTPADTSFVGDLSDCRIYGRALTAEEILELYHTSMNVDSAGNISARILS